MHRRPGGGSGGGTFGNTPQDRVTGGRSRPRELVALSLRLSTVKFDGGGAHLPALALTVSVDIQFQNSNAILCEGVTA